MTLAILGATRTPTVVVIDPYDVVYAGIKSWFTDDRSAVAHVVGHYRTTGEFLADDHADHSNIDVILAASTPTTADPTSRHCASCARRAIEWWSTHISATAM